MTTISARSAVKLFGRLRAVDRVSFSIKPGINIILGPNGAGKSTLLRCIDGLYRLEGGSMKVLGADPFENDELKNRVSLLSDNYSLYDYLTVNNNLRFFGRLYGLRDGETLIRANRILRELNARQYLNTKVFALSRGTKQKVAFCRAVLNDPEVLLLDEPSAFLDASSSEAIRRFIENYREQGRTVLYVTQKLDEVTRFNGRVMVMKNGKIIKDMKPGKLDLLKNSFVEIRMVKPLKEGAVRFLKRYDYEMRGLTLRVRVSDYRQVNRILSELLRRGSYVIGVDYLEPFIEKIS